MPPTAWHRRCWQRPCAHSSGGAALLSKQVATNLRLFIPALLTAVGPRLPAGLDMLHEITTTLWSPAVRAGTLHLSASRSRLRRESTCRHPTQSVAEAGFVENSYPCVEPTASDRAAVARVLPAVVARCATSRPTTHPLRVAVPKAVRGCGGTTGHDSCRLRLPRRFARIADDQLPFYVMMCVEFLPFSHIAPPLATACPLAPGHAAAALRLSTAHSLHRAGTSS